MLVIMAATMRMAMNGFFTKKRTHVRVLFFVKKPFIAILMVAAMMTSIFVIYPALPSGFLPEMDEGAIVLDFDSPPGTSLEETEIMLGKVDRIIDQIPEVQSY